MKLIDARGRIFHPGMIAEVPTGNLLWVDPVNGSDALAVRGGMTTAFRTLAAAKNAAKSATFDDGEVTEAGDTIVVLPGLYSETNLAKHGVNWHFMNGARVSWTDSNVSIFKAEEDAIFKVTGWGCFKCGETNHVLEVHDTAKVEFACSVMAGGAAVVQIWGGETVVVADSLYSSEGSTVDVKDGQLTLEANEISCGTYAGFYSDGGETRLRARKISAPIPAVYCILDGQAEIEAGEIHSSGDAVLYDAADGALTLRNARIISDSGWAVTIYNGSSGSPPTCRLWNCHLKSANNSTPTVFAPGEAASNVGLYGQCTGNADVDTDWITVVGTPLTVADLD